jgi:sec-independent protein translocase protein TatC
MSEPSEKLHEGTLLSHLLELRDRLMRAVIAIFVLFLPCAYFANDLFEMLARPWLAKVQAGGGAMVATGVMTPFTTPFKLAFWVALFAAMPYVLAQIWGFVAPGLYRHEKRFAMPLLASSIALFYAGASFAYFLIFPVMAEFFASTTPQGVQMMTDINLYLDFALTMFLAFGVAFETPIAVILLVITGMVSVEKLSEARGYVIIGIFVVAAFLTPPDALSQVMLAIPMWLLYEVGVLFSRGIIKARRRREAEEEAAEAGGKQEP